MKGEKQTDLEGLLDEHSISDGSSSTTDLSFDITTLSFGRWLASGIMEGSSCTPLSFDSRSARDASSLNIFLSVKFHNFSHSNAKQISWMNVVLITN